MRFGAYAALLALALAGCGIGDQQAGKAKGSADADASLWPAAASPAALTSPVGDT